MVEKNNQSICRADKYGNKWWYFNKRLHRLDGPAIEYVNGTKCWYFDHLLHREDGPAIEYTNGSRCWYFYGQYHRLDGPAEDYIDGDKYWWYHGEQIKCSSQKAFERLIKLKVLW